MPKRARAVRFPEIAIERADGTLHQQIYRSLRRAIVAGGITPGTHLPSTRALSRRLKVSRNTVLSAYERLVGERYVVSRTGSGTRVARAVPATYLREVVAAVLAKRGVSLQRLLQESSYPVTVAPFTDPAGNSLYVFDSGDRITRHLR